MGGVGPPKALPSNHQVIPGTFTWWLLARYWPILGSGGVPVAARVTQLRVRAPPCCGYGIPAPAWLSGLCVLWPVVNAAHGFVPLWGWGWGSGWARARRARLPLTWLG